MNIVRYGVVAVAVFSFGGGTPLAGAGEREHDPGVRSADDSRDHHQEAMRVEREYRHRIARVNRLREIAVQQNDSDRVDDLDELHDRLRAGYTARLSEIRNRMDDRSAKRLAETRAEGKDHEDWVREHQDRAEEFWEEHREWDSHRRARREHRTDRAESKRDRRADHRETRREHRADRRESSAERRADRRETRREHHRDHRREIRGDARDRAEQHWLDARDETVAGVRPARHMNHAASRLADKRWREEARDRSAERWERAARRSGMLDTDRSSRRFGAPSHRAVDAEVGSRISRENADREFERLMREVGERD